MRHKIYGLQPVNSRRIGGSLNLRRLSTWQAFKRTPHMKLPLEWRKWVLDSGSLTKRLIKASHGDFRVHIVYQGLAYPTRDEMMSLGMSGRQLALVREVELLCGGIPWVVARSVIPLSTLSGPEKELACLGTKPLGAFLFSASTMKRKPLEIANFMPISHGNADQNKSDQIVFGRRSVFLLHQKPLLVSELFLPVIIAHEPSLSR